jgi:hypothetical protein
MIHFLALMVPSLAPLKRKPSLAGSENEWIGDSMTTKALIGSNMSEFFEQIEDGQ